jgi:hypothetical protein
MNAKSKINISLLAAALTALVWSTASYSAQVTQRATTTSATTSTNRSNISTSPPTLDQATFASSKDWFVDNKPLSDNGEEFLYFRRYFTVVMDDTINLDAGLPNALFYKCSKQYDSVVVFHVPDNMDTKNFKKDLWLPKTEFHVLADGTGMTFQGEYIQGDMFIDVTPDTAKRLMAVLNATYVTVEFRGDKRESQRLELYQGDKAPNGGNLRGFLRGFLATQGKTHPISSDALTSVCNAFKASKKAGTTRR